MPGHHRPHEGPEQRQPLVRQVRVGQEVAGGQDDGDELHAVNEAVQRHGAQRSLSSDGDGASPVRLGQQESGNVVHSFA